MTEEKEAALFEALKQIHATAMELLNSSDLSEYAKKKVLTVIDVAESGLNAQNKQSNPLLPTFLCCHFCNDADGISCHCFCCHSCCHLITFVARFSPSAPQVAVDWYTRQCGVFSHEIRIFRIYYHFLLRLVSLSP